MKLVDFFVFLLGMSRIAGFRVPIAAKSFNIKKVCPLYMSKVYRGKPAHKMGVSFSKSKLQPKRRQVVVGRTTRILREALSAIICGSEHYSPEAPPAVLMQAISFPHIEFNSDLSIADVWVSPYGNAMERRRVFLWLNRRIHRVQHALHRALAFLRRCPKVRFHLTGYYDAGEDQRLWDKMEKWIKENAPDDYLSSVEKHD
jgi:ribosome-binding factor A